MISIRTLIVVGLIAAILFLGGTILFTIQNSLNLTAEIKNSAGRLSEMNRHVADIATFIVRQYLLAHEFVNESDKDEFIRLSYLVAARFNQLDTPEMSPTEQERLKLIKSHYAEFERQVVFLFSAEAQKSEVRAQIITKLDREVKDFTDELVTLSTLSLSRSKRATTALVDALQADSSLITLLLSFMLLAAVAFLLTFYFAVLRPATKLIEATILVAAGNLKISVETPAVSEIKTLLNSFNRMVKTLDENRDEITGKNRQLEGLNREISQLNLGLEKKVEERSAQLRESQEYLRRIIYGSPVSIAIFTRDGLLEDCNDAFLPIVHSDSRQTCIGSARVGVHPALLEPAFVDSFLQAAEGHAVKTPPLAVSQEIIVGWYVHQFVPHYNLHGSVVKILCYSVDVTVERAARETALSKNAELESFVFSVSHDLKAPLFSVKGLLPLLRHDERDIKPVDRDDLITRIQANVANMEQLISDLLNLSRAGANRENFSGFRPGDLLRMIYLEEKVISGQRDAELVLETEGKVFADQRLVTQLFRNLFSNAFKYRDLSRPLLIRIRSKHDGELVRFEFEDNGIGIQPEIVPKIFDVFFRSAPEGVEGSGVGLAIVKKIVESHGGRISVSSVAGEGTVFSFTLAAAALD